MRSLRASLAGLLALTSASAHAQLAAQDREDGIPAGLTLPVLGAAAAEEPIALDVNPAGVGFVGGFALQYFHEGVPERGTIGDGVYLADRFGPLAIGFGQEWLRPGDAPLARYQRSRLALALTDGRSGALGFGWTWIRSGDGALEQAGSWEIGFTSRPLRHLSLAAAALGNDARIGDVRLPVRFDVGAAARGWGDRLTVSADLLADDADGQAFRPTYARLGAGVELGSGLAASLRVEVPVRDDAERSRDVSGILAVTWNQPHAGVTAGATSFDDRTGWLAGLRLSQERYRAGGSGRALASLSLPRDLEPERFLFLTLGDRDPYGRLVERLVAAADDPDVGAVLLRIERAPFGSGRVEELRALVARVRSRKPVLAYLTGGGTREYWLASAATAVASPPGAPILLNGLSTSQLYYRDLLARLGVIVQVVRAGAYKSATEPLVRSGPSPEAAQMRDAILDDVYGRFVADVAAARRIEPQRVRALVDQGIFTSDEARRAGLLDATPWPDEVRRWAGEVAGRRLGEPGRYRPEPPRAAQRWGRPPVVEVIRLSGIIARGSQPGAPGIEGAGATGVAAELRRAAQDPEVRAIVLRVDSPGGDAFASDLLWREVMVARRKGKPVVASMGDVAASGGYLAAAAADTIVAEPSTITGSIGVFAAKPDLAGLLGKLPVQRSAAVRGEKADALSVLRPWNDAERSAVQRQVDAFYATFVDRVAEGRKLPRAEVEQVAAGRVWTGQQALERRLVDRLGTLADAIALAREAAGLAQGDEEVRWAGRKGILPALSLPPLAGAGAGATLERLVRLSPELDAVLLLADGSVGPVLALPEEWVGAAP
jgi:protease-4